MIEPKGAEWLLNCEPYPAQIEAINRSWYGVSYYDELKNKLTPPELLEHHPYPVIGWAHFMEMRVGKTPVALNEFMLFKKYAPLDVQALVFSPNRYKYEWAEEAKKFGVDVPIFVYESTHKKYFEQTLRGIRSGFLVCNYEALTYVENRVILAEWVKSEPTMMIFDESAMVKNHKSGFFKHAQHLAKHAYMVRILSGLPAPQGPHDLWAQLRMIREIEGVAYEVFKHRFCRIIRVGGFKKVAGIKNGDGLNELLGKCSFRARRAVWGTKIDTDYEIVNIEMDPKQINHYTDMDKKFVVWLEEGSNVTAEQVTTKRMKLQQISSGFIYDEERQFRPLMEFKNTPKFKDLLHRLQMCVSTKVMIVAHYKYTVSSLYESLKSYNPALMAGGVTMKKLGLNLEKEKKRFNEDPECRVLIGQSMALKYGHTLMGTKDNPCISTCFFENTYSLDTRGQVEERNQGEGQQAAIHVWDYSSSDIEHDILTALQRKKSVVEAIMNYYNQEKLMCRVVAGDD